jgi:hypothetical protein
VQPDKNISDPIRVPPSSNATDDSASLLFMVLIFCMLNAKRETLNA